MVRFDRRTLVSGVAATGAAALIPGVSSLAQEGSPTPVDEFRPGYATTRVRVQPSAELNHAIYPHVMATLLPSILEIPGTLGYTFVFDDADPATAFVFSTATDETAAVTSEDLASEWVQDLDPRFVTETPDAHDGLVRMYATTDKPSTELPPYLHGAAFTLRDQTNAEGVDLDSAVDIATETLIPLFQSLPGFVLYCWFERPGGRVAINIWETHEDLVAAGDELAAWREEYFATPTASERVAYDGTIGYSTIAGLT